MADRERFLAVMGYQPKDRVSNHELGVWPQTIARWDSEGAPPEGGRFDWWQGSGPLNLDKREFIPVNFDIVPPFEPDQDTYAKVTGISSCARDESGSLLRLVRVCKQTDIVPLQ